MPAGSATENISSIKQDSSVAVAVVDVPAKAVVEKKNRRIAESLADFYYQRGFLLPWRIFSGKVFLMVFWTGADLIYIEKIRQWCYNLF